MMGKKDTRRNRALIIGALVALCAALAVPLADAGPKKKKNARITGGGSVFTTDGTRVTHGFQLRCDYTDDRQNLEINWLTEEEEMNFHLLDLETASCYDDPDIEAGHPSQPRTNIDTFEGVAEGRLNGEEGATVTFLLSDAGEPGTSDVARFVIRDPEGNVVLDVEGTLEKGNHQFHFVRS